MLLAASLISMIIILPVAGELGRRAKAADEIDVGAEAEAPANQRAAV